MEATEKKFPTIVCLCGSTRFEKEFLDAAQAETLAGRIVLSVGMFSHSRGIILSDELKRKLDELHKRKIDISDEIFVVNPGNYIGSSTRSEIEYAKKLKIPIRYLVKELS
jgi:hypothetical protein